MKRKNVIHQLKYTRNNTTDIMRNIQFTGLIIWWEQTKVLRYLKMLIPIDIIYYNIILIKIKNMFLVQVQGISYSICIYIYKHL